MSIRSRLTIIILSLVAIPLLFVSAVTFSNYKNSLTTSRLSQLQSVACFKAEAIQAYFESLKNTLEMSRGFYNVRKNLPVLSRTYKDLHNPEAVVARKTLDGQMVRMQKALDLADIMLADNTGAIVYVSNPAHYALDLYMSLDEISPESLRQGSKDLYFSDVFINRLVGNKPEMLATAPITDMDGAPAGTFILEIDMAPLYRLIQDTMGLGATGEILIGKKSGNDIVYLNSLRHDNNVVLSRHVRIGDKTGLPIQNGVVGKTGIGMSVDYRGNNVVAAWTHIAFPDWGLVAKIDAREEFAVVTNLQRLLLMVLAVVFVMSGIITFSVAQSISVPIQKLAKGAEIIGGGNLDHKVGMDLNDEIGRLSRSFDKMTHDLRTTLASRDELNKEIEIRKMSEDALRESEERFRVIADASPVQISVGREEDGTILFANPEYERAFGFAKGELIGHKTPELYADPAERDKVISALRESGALRNYEVQVKKSDGTPFWVSLSINHINYAGGPALLATSIDITERKRAEEELRLRTEELKASNEELTFFNRTMADREERMIELKKQANELCRQLGQPPRYDVDFGEEQQ